MSVGDLLYWFELNWESLQKSILAGWFRPTAVLGVEIPKDTGGMRQLGIPTVIGRVVQQAIIQVLQVMYDPHFSECSYGFRPKRSAHDALIQSSKNVAEGKYIIVNIDLAKFFDEVNHDVLMERLSRKISDKVLLKLIRRFFQAGMMQNGVAIDRRKGMPQGGPCPLFWRIYFWMNSIKSWNSVSLHLSVMRMTCRYMFVRTKQVRA